MATEPERKIEQLLRAYAQKRREEAGDRFELHPATRRLLQAEVARLRPRTNESDTWLGLVTRIWLRAGLAVSILVVLGMAVWLMQPWGKQPLELALKENAPAAAPLVANEPAPTMPTPPPPAALPVPALAEESQDAEAVGMRGLRSEPIQEKTPALDSLKRAEQVAKTPARRSEDKAVMEERLAATRSVAKASDKAEADRLAGRAGASGPAKEAGGGMGGGGGYRPTEQNQPATSSYYAGLAAKNGLENAITNNLLADTRGDERFRSFGARVAGSAPAEGTTLRADVALRGQQRLNLYDQSQVSRQRFAKAMNRDTMGRASVADLTAPLSSFTLEQTGHRVRIIDADGSVYEGQLLAAVEEKKADEFKQKAAIAKDGQTLSGLKASTNAMTFQVSGTNLTLKQMVVVQASVSPAPAIDAGLTSKESSAGTAPALAGRPAAAPALETAGPRGGAALRDSESARGRLGALFLRQAPASGSGIQFQGTARIGNNSEVPIKAIRVAP